MPMVSSYVGQELIPLLRLGNREAFERLFKLFSAKVYRFAWGYLKSREDAEEIVQEVFMKLWDKRETLQEDRSLNNFIFTIAHNAIVNQIRKTVNGKKALLEKKYVAPEGHLHVEEAVVYEEIEKAALVAISSLPPQRKQIYMLSRQEHLTYQEIASRLKISPKTVEVHMVLALKDIRRYLVRLGF